MEESLLLGSNPNTGAVDSRSDEAELLLLQQQQQQQQQGDGIQQDQHQIGVILTPGRFRLLKARRRVHAMSYRCKCCLFGGLIFSLFVAIGIPLIVSWFVDASIREQLIVDSRESDGFQQFANKSTTGTNLMKFYMFNITNPHEILQGEKPNLHQVGPFIYRLSQIRDGFVWNETEDTLQYREHSWYEFDAEATRKHGYESDDVPVLSLNLIFFGMEAQVGKAYWHLVADELLWKTDFHRLFTVRSVREYLMGYKMEAKLFDGLVTIPIQFPGILPNKTMENDEDYLYPTTMRVGAKDINTVYEIVKWREMENVTIICPWGGNDLPFGQWCPGHYPCCRHDQKDPNARVPVWDPEIVPNRWDANANQVHGRNGEQFHPNLRHRDELIIFNDIIYRAIRFVNQNNEKVRFRGISMLRYTPHKETFQNAEQLPSNRRYYQFGPEGLIGNLSMIEQGCDLYASLPHFYGGSKELQSMVTGLKPDKRNHSLVIDVEPILGMTMREHLRAQVNGKLYHGERWGFDDWFPNVRAHTIVPIAWFEQYSAITQEGADEFKMIYIAQHVSQASIVIGAIATLLFASPITLLFF